ncbi:uncharacterized protein FFB14_15360 [Fusarium fujikuroi]|nr:uncharacterized protein FFB14_15360 [Fusarium fujikuroi]
MYIAGFLALR